MLEMIDVDLLSPKPASDTIGNVTYYRDLLQGSDEWLAARCGLLTASTMKNLVTPKLSIANNESTRLHFYELMAQRITKYVEPSYINDDMLRGASDEMDALLIYAEKYHPIQNIGFMTNSKWGFTIGYSPDALVGDIGLVECKSRAPKHQMKTIMESVIHSDEAPNDFMIQIQTGLLVSERQWIDLVSYCSGLPMATMRVFPDINIQQSILTAAEEFEQKMKIEIENYGRHILQNRALIATQRKEKTEMYL